MPDPAEPPPSSTEGRPELSANAQSNPPADAQAAPKDAVSKPRIADRPHHITILLGILSPSIALLAFALSFQSLRTSESALDTSIKALKIGQRAYLSVAKTRCERHGKSVLFIVSLTNIGKSPAYIRSGASSALVGIDFENEQKFFRSIATWDPRVKLQGTEFSKVLSSQVDPAEIPPGQEMSTVIRCIGCLDDFGDGADLAASVEFEDVFGDKHPLLWAWSLYLQEQDRVKDLPYRTAGMLLCNSAAATGAGRAACEKFGLPK